MSTRNIITVEEAKTYGRPIGKVSEEKILSFIAEVENTIIRKALGDSLYLSILNDDPSEDIQMLLEGGIYETDCGEQKIVSGLKVTEAYYVYAQNVRVGDFESTRYGMAIKDGQYSSNLTQAERDIAANAATVVADSYLRECVEYCKAKRLLGKAEGNLHLTAGCIIHRIKSV